MKSNRKRSNLGVALLEPNSDTPSATAESKLAKGATACSLGAYYPMTKRPAVMLPTSMRWGSVQHFALG
jgi:hypothetical protein